MKIKVIIIDATNLYGWAMSKSLLFEELQFDKVVKLEDIFNFPGGSDFGCFIEVGLKYPNKQRRKLRVFHLVLKTKLVLKIILVVIWTRWNRITIHKLKSYFVMELIKEIFIPF